MKWLCQLWILNYMAMGDNTANSKDTRYFGLVSEPRIKGELLIRWWPLSRIGLL